MSSRQNIDGNESSDDEGDDDVEYGLRRSRRRVSYYRCDSSSLHPAHMMEQEVYYSSAIKILQYCTLYMQMTGMLTTFFLHYSSIIAQLERLHNIPSSVVDHLKCQVNQLKESIQP